MFFSSYFKWIIVTGLQVKAVTGAFQGWYLLPINHKMLRMKYLQSWPGWWSCCISATYLWSWLKTFSSTLKVRTRWTFNIDKVKIDCDKYEKTLTQQKPEDDFLFLKFLYWLSQSWDISQELNHRSLTQWQWPAVSRDAFATKKSSLC